MLSITSKSLRHLSKRANPENLLNLKTNGLLVFVFNYHFQYKLILRSFQNSMCRYYKVNSVLILYKKICETSVSNERYQKKALKCVEQLIK